MVLGVLSRSAAAVAVTARPTVAVLWTAAVEEVDAFTGLRVGGDVPAKSGQLCAETSSREAPGVVAAWRRRRRPALQLKSVAVLAAALELQVVEAVDELNGVHGGVPFAVLHGVAGWVA